MIIRNRSFGSRMNGSTCGFVFIRRFVNHYFVILVQNCRQPMNLEDLIGKVDLRKVNSDVTSRDFLIFLIKSSLPARLSPDSLQRY